MKFTVLLGLLLAAACGPVHGQIHLSVGQSYAYQFNSLPLVGFLMPQPPYVGGPNAGVFLFPGARVYASEAFAPGGLSSGSVLRVELFEDSPDQAPFASETFVGPGDVPRFPSFLIYAGGWDDLQGSVRFTALSGSVTIGQFTVESIRQTQVLESVVYSSSVTPVPEPSTLALFGVVILGGFIGRSARTKVSSSRQRAL